MNTIEACPTNASTSTPNQPSRTAAPTRSGWTATATSPRSAANATGPPGHAAWKSDSAQSQIQMAGTVTTTDTQ